MLNLTGNGVPIPKVVELVEKLVPPDDQTPPRHAHIRSALSINDKESKVVRMIVTLCEPKPVEKTERRFDTAVLSDSSVEMSEFWATLKGCVSAKQFVLAGAKQAVHENANHEFICSGNGYTGPFPCCLINLPMSERQPVQDWGRPLLQYGLPVYGDFEDAIRTWFPTTPFHGQSDSLNGFVQIAVPLAWPHFGEIRLEEGRLHVHFEARQEIECKLIAKSRRTVAIRESLRITSDSIVVDLAAEIDELKLWLIDSESTTLDCFSESGYSCSRTERVLHVAPSTGTAEGDILAQIRGGESDTLELKPFVRIPDPKAEELGRTAVAFANAGGGDIYVGVNDQCEVEGVEKEAFNLYRKDRGAASPADAVALYCQDLRKHLAESARPSLRTEVEPIPLAGRTVVRVRVSESAEKPVTDALTGNMLIRRGASNGKVNADEIKRIVAESRDDRVTGGRPYFGIPYGF